MRPLRIAVLVGVATVVVFVFTGAVGAVHWASASPGQSLTYAVGTGFLGSAATAPTASCPASGPLGGLDTAETIGVLAITFVFGMGGGIGVYRIVTTGRHGGYITREGADGATTITPATGGSGAGKIREDTWTDGGVTMADDIAREPKV